MADLSFEDPIRKASVAAVLCGFSQAAHTDQASQSMVLHLAAWSQKRPGP